MSGGVGHYTNIIHDRVGEMSPELSSAPALDDRREHQSLAALDNRFK